MRLKVTWVLIGANLAALSVAVWSVAAALSSPAFPQAESSAPDPALSPPPEAPEPSIEKLLDSPLFTPSRHRYAPPEQIPAQAPPPAPPRLVGIVQDGTVASRALLESVAGETRRLMGPGERFDGWVVTEIGRDAVELMFPPSSDTSAPGVPLPLHLHPADRSWTTTNE